MYSKFILSSNWKSLSSNYKFDPQINLNNQNLIVDGNLTLNYSSSLSNIIDYSNNNYSLFFLSNNTNINNIINFNVPNIDTNKQVCLLAINMVNNLVTDNTRFLKLDNNTIFLDTITNLNNNNFFELEFVSANEVYVYTLRNNIYYFLSVDDISLNITFLSTNNIDFLSNYQKGKISFNFLLDKNKNNILFYKTIQNKNYVMSSLSDQILLIQTEIENIRNSDFFTIIKYGNLPKSNLMVNWLSYLPSIDNFDISIKKDKSLYNLKNNFLIHNEYNNINNNSIDLNFIPLKNQIDVKDNVLRNNNSNTFREYNNIHTGGNREGGNINISLSYTSNLHPIKIYSDKTTWFHLPFNKNITSTNINDSNFILNGANPGLSPIFSDKIFKKAANYSESSSMGNAKDVEHSGVWLCSWLSGGNDNARWVDRFYNPNTFTLLEALKYNTNVNYTPQYSGKYEEGITDTPSKLTLEEGCWYSYSRIGKKTAQNLIKSNSDKLISSGLHSFKNKNKAFISPKIDQDNELIYEFNGNEFGEISLSGLKYNNFTISFFATRKDWNKKDQFQILGNYIDSGFGIFNDISITPLIYYYNNNIFKLKNNKLKDLLEIDILNYVKDSSTNIVGLFRRDLNSNFHILTNNKQLLEFSSNGTIVNSLSFGNLMSSEIISYSNNLNKGYILDNNLTILEYDIISNTLKDISVDINITRVNFEFTDILRYNLTVDNYNNVYLINGLYPIIKGTNLYFLNTDSKSLLIYNINNNTQNVYLSSSNNIMSYGFDGKGKTYLLYKDKISEYDALGVFTKDHFFVSNNNTLTGLNILFQNFNNTDHISVHLIDSANKNYLYNISLSTIKILDSNFNTNFNKNFNISEKNYDFTNYNYNQSIVNSIVPLPSYIFRIKLINQLNSKDSKILNINLLGELLNSGEHHFAVTLDTILGRFSLYVDGKIYRTIFFNPKKYTFSYLFNDNMIVGSTPFYGNRLYSDFYKDANNFLFFDDLKIEKIKTFNNSFNSEEIRMLYFEKYSPKDIVVEVPIGDRNYIDTISRVFRHKLQGHKSNLINLIINDSLIIDKDIQKMCELSILESCKSVLPMHVKINNITWLNNKDSDEKMLEGNFNTRNTVTEAR